jgi:hypothetical protein
MWSPAKNPCHDEEALRVAMARRCFDRPDLVASILEEARAEREKLLGPYFEVRSRKSKIRTVHGPVRYAHLKSA